MVDPRKQKLFVTFLVVLMLGLLIFGFAVPTLAAGKLETVKVVFPRARELAGEDVYLHIANKMGYAAEEGIQFTFESALGTVDCTKLISTGQADVAYPSSYVAITARSKGLPIKMIYDTLQTNIFGFGVRPDSGIKSIRDLKGKKIALGDSGWTVIAAPILKAAGLTEKDVEWVVAGEGRQLAVWEKKTDAVLTWEMEYQNWASSGISLRFLAGQDYLDYQSNGLTVSDALIQKRPDLVERIARAAAKGAVFSLENPEAAAEIALETFPGVTPKSFKGMVDVVKALNALMAPPWTKDKGLGVCLMEKWQKQIDDMYAAGVILNKIRAEDVVSNRFIKAANDFDHERIRQDARNYVLKRK
ncbi:MAG: ABC transporter substrate-binding protein [Firmicutes bacterium]|nr:ABC transporter substrate-binding protein [Bacillota bacterium]